MKITIEDNEHKAVVELPDDSDIFEVGENIKGLLVAYGFHPDNVDELFNLDRWESKEDDIPSDVPDV